MITIDCNDDLDKPPSSCKFEDIVTKQSDRILVLGLVIEKFLKMVTHIQFSYKNFMIISINFIIKFN